MSKRGKKSSNSVTPNMSDGNSAPSNTSKSTNETDVNKALSQYAPYVNDFSNSLDESILIKGRDVYYEIGGLYHWGVYYYTTNLYYKDKVTRVYKCGDDERYHFKVKSFDDFTNFDPLCDAFIYDRRDPDNVKSHLIRVSGGGTFAANDMWFRRLEGVVNNKFRNRNYVSVFSIRDKETLEETIWAIHMKHFELPISFWTIWAESDPLFRDKFRSYEYNPFILGDDYFINNQKLTYEDKSKLVFDLLGESSSGRDNINFDFVTFH
jgi:hypothetical protein